MNTYRKMATALMILCAASPIFAMESQPNRQDSLNDAKKYLWALARHEHTYARGIIEALPKDSGFSGHKTLMKTLITAARVIIHTQCKDTLQENAKIVNDPTDPAYHAFMQRLSPLDDILNEYDDTELAFAYAGTRYIYLAVKNWEKVDRAAQLTQQNNSTATTDRQSIATAPAPHNSSATTAAGTHTSMHTSQPASTTSGARRIVVTLDDLAARDPKTNR